jgi:hypothetical protein
MSRSTAHELDQIGHYTMSASCSKAPENVVPAPLPTLSVHKMSEQASPICQIWYMQRIRPDLPTHNYFISISFDR